MGGESSKAAWAAAVCGAVLIAVQTALAASDALTLRFVAPLIVTAGAALIARRGRLDAEAPPDPTALILGGLAGLCLFPVAWWAMDLADHLLRANVGLLPLPALLSRDADRLLGRDLRSASYEVAVLCAVVLIPLAQSSLLWRTLRRDLGASLGLRRGTWAAGIIGGCVLALSAPQQVEPALPYGLASLPGYLLVGVIAAWAAASSRSWWAGVAAQGTFAYASLALRDDLVRALSGKGYGDPAWLSVLLLGSFGAAVALQVLRYRSEAEVGAGPAARSARGRFPALAAGVVFTALIALTIIDLAQRG